MIIKVCRAKLVTVLLDRVLVPISLLLAKLLVIVTPWEHAWVELIDVRVWCLAPLEGRQQHFIENYLLRDIG